VDGIMTHFKVIKAAGNSCIVKAVKVPALPTVLGQCPVRCGNMGQLGPGLRKICTVVRMEREEWKSKCHFFFQGSAG
jgi:hypothetical protein